MLLKNSLYTIEKLEKLTSSDEIVGGSFLLRLNLDHVIYQAHFPGEPITPGVCIVQMGKELMEELLDKSLEVARVKNVKFLSVISPKDTTSITYTFRKIEWSADGKEVKAQIVVTSGDEAKAKISFGLRVVEKL